MRLTEKRNGIYDKDNMLSNGMPRLDLKEWKLSQLEDIEEEIGISLITLFKALKNGIYVRRNNEIKKYYIYQYEPNVLWFDTIKAFEGIVYRFNWREDFYTNEEKYIKNYKSYELYNRNFSTDIYNTIYIKLKDYGKTWALTREELL